MLAGALERLGWSVWWDREIVAGESFDQAIERELAAARAVVVLWSAVAVGSEWVKNEAADAAARGLLVPAVLDGATLPLEFRRRQAANLAGWGGEREHEGFSSLCHGIAARLGVASVPMPVPPHVEPTPAVRRPPAARAIVLALALVLGTFLAWRLTGQRDATGGVADVVVGTYFGDVYSDAKGHAQSDVTVTITKLGPRRVRVSADYERLHTVDVDVSRVLDKVMSVGSKVTFMVEPNGGLTFSPDGEVSYQGRRR